MANSHHVIRSSRELGVPPIKKPKQMPHFKGHICPRWAGLRNDFGQIHIHFPNICSNIPRAQCIVTTKTTDKNNKFVA